MSGKQMVDFPSRWKMLKNLLWAAKNVIKEGLNVRSSEEIEEILEI